MHKVPLIKSSINIPVVEISLNTGVKAFALLDTGSEVTLFDQEFIKENKECFHICHTDNKVTMIGLYAEKDNYDIHLFTDIDIDGHRIEVNDAMPADFNMIKGVLSGDNPIIISAILGCDTLQSNKVKIDFKNDLLII